MNKFNSLLVLVVLAVVGAVAKAEIIPPEVVTTVAMSNRDVNRVVCTSGNINDVYYSQEKGVLVTNDGKNAYVKFVIKNDGFKESHVSIRTELYIVCNGSVFTLMVEPKNIEAQTHRLSSGTENNMKSNISLLGPLAEEERALYLTMAVLKDDIPDSFTEKKEPMYSREWRFDVIDGAEVAKERTINVDGLGLFLTEYRIKARNELYLKESLFLQQFFGSNMFSITVDPLHIKPGQVARVLVVEKEVL